MPEIREPTLPENCHAGFAAVTVYDPSLATVSVMPVSRYTIRADFDAAAMPHPPKSAKMQQAINSSLDLSMLRLQAMPAPFGNPRCPKLAATEQGTPAPSLATILLSLISLVKRR